VSRLSAASAPVGERTPARERADEAIRTAAAAALAHLRAGEVDAALAAISGMSDRYGREARQAVRANVLDVTAGTHHKGTDIRRDVFSLLRARCGHTLVSVALEPGAVAGLARCAGCGREARLLKVWGRWHLVGSGDRRTDLTAGRCAGMRAA